MAVGLKRHRVHVLFEDLKGGEGQLLFVFLIGGGNYRGCNSQMIELRFGKCGFQGTVKKSHTRMAFHCLLSKAIFVIYLHPQIPFPFAALFSRVFYISGMSSHICLGFEMMFFMDHLVSMALIASYIVFMFYVIKVLKGCLLLLLLLLVKSLFFTPSWKRKLTKHKKRSSWLIHTVYFPLKSCGAVAFSYSHTIETVWCHGNCKRRRCLSWHSSRWPTLHAVSLLYLNHLG